MSVKNIDNVWDKLWSEIHFAKAIAWFALGMAVGGPSCWTSWGCFAVAIRDLIRSIMCYVDADEAGE